MDICDSRVTFAAEKVYFNDVVLLKDILSLALALGWKNEKRPSGAIELDLEAGNLVLTKILLFREVLELFLTLLVK